MSYYVTYFTALQVWVGMLIEVAPIWFSKGLAAELSITDFGNGCPIGCDNAVKQNVRGRIRKWKRMSDRNGEKREKDKKSQVINGREA